MPRRLLYGVLCFTIDAACFTPVPFDVTYATYALLIHERAPLICRAMRVCCFAIFRCCAAMPRHDSYAML